MRIPISILLVAALTATACSPESEPETAGCGQVEFRCGTDPTVIQRDGALNRAETGEGIIELPASIIPQHRDFSLVITNTETAATYEYPKMADYNKPMLPAGTYKASVRYGSPDAEGGVSAACFAGSKEFKIVARKSTVEPVEAALANSAVRILRNSWFDNYYHEPDFTLRTESGTSIGFGSRTGEFKFVKAGTRLYLKGTAVKTNGVKVSFPETEIGTTSARTLHTIRVEASRASHGSIHIVLDDTMTDIPVRTIELNPEL